MTQQLTALQMAQQAAAAAAAVSNVDMTETATGGGERVVLDTGRYLGRLVEYVEYGTQKNVFDAAKPPRPVCRLAFAVFPFVTDPTSGARSVSKDPVMVRTSDTTISNHEKAGLKKLYNKMNWKNDASKSHVAMFLGEPFMLGVIRAKTQDGKREYNKLDTNDVSAALDPMSGQPYAVPEVQDSMYRAFFWDMPDQASWDALYIEGSTDDGKSKNFIQDTMLGAVDYAGSALEQMLTGSLSVPVAPPETPAETPVETTAEPTAPVPPAVPDLGAAATVPTL